MRSFIQKLVTNSGPALEPDPDTDRAWNDAAADADLDAAIHDAMHPQFAAEAAENFLHNALAKLDDDINQYTRQIADLNAKLDSAKLAHKAFGNALSTIDTANKAKIAAMPQAVTDSRVTF